MGSAGSGGDYCQDWGCEVSGHTPGPWLGPDFESNDDDGDRGWWIHNGELGGGKIAIAVTFVLNPNAEADARLIAAAPELLAVLKHIRRCIPMGGFSQIHDGSATVADIDAAIAKATGEEL